MKIKAAGLLILMSITTFSYGQKFTGGISGGINASQIDNDGYGGFNKLGLSAGGFVGREITPNLSWQMELKYSARGMYHHPTQSQPYIEESRLHYAELPLSIRYLYSEKFDLEFGFSPDVLLRAIYLDEDGFLDPVYAPDLRKFGVTAFAGIYYHFIKSMAVGIRYNYSVFPFYAFDYWTPRYRDKGYFHDILNLSVKYYFIR